MVPANIYDFITSLPQGFDTQVGGKGSQLSGGQKRQPCINAVSNLRCSLHIQSALLSLERFSGILKCYFWTRSATMGTTLFPNAYNWSVHQATSALDSTSEKVVQQVSFYVLVRMLQCVLSKFKYRLLIPQPRGGRPSRLLIACRQFRMRTECTIFFVNRSLSIHPNTHIDSSSRRGELQRLEPMMSCKYPKLRYRQTYLICILYFRLRLKGG